MSQQVRTDGEPSVGLWLPLTEYSVRSGVSLSTIRRKIKSNSIPFKLEKGKYLILFNGSEGETREPQATTTPIAPPTTAIKILSVRSCRTIRQRPAPSAVRMTISRPRSAPLANKRFAKFAHAISNTRLTAANRMSKALRDWPTILSCKAMSAVLRFLLSAGYCFASCSSISRISALACCRVTPGASRP